MNGISICLDEIALEGLDGITLSTLWRRLKTATPRLCSTLDVRYKAFLWKSIHSSRNVQTFLLEKPREKLKHFSDDTQAYPFSCINDQESGVRGSCSMFYSRNLTDVSKLSLEIVEETYGDRMVLVASQLLRERVLFGPEVDPFVDLSDMAYCVLEWIGRARKYGRWHADCSTFFGMDLSTGFYHVKVLLELEMVTKQCMLKSARSKSRILYLTRFHVEHSRESLSYRLCRLIEKMPKECLPLTDLCLHFEESQETIEKTLQELSESGHIRYMDSSEDQFDEDEEEMHVARCQTDKVIQLLRPFYCVCNDEEEEEEEEKEFLAGNEGLSMKIHAEVPLNNCIYQMMESTGIKGMTIAECAECLGLSFYDVRTIFSHLESQQKATVIVDDNGPCITMRYIASKVFKQQNKDMFQSDPQPMEHEVCQTEPLTNESSIATADCTEQARKSVNIPEATKATPPCSSQKFNNRRKIIIDFLKKEQVIEGHHMLRQLITEKEIESGSTVRIDKKTLDRLLERLKNAGSIRIFNIDVKVEDKNRKLVLICDSKIKEDGPEVLAKISLFKNAALLKKMKEAKPAYLVDKFSSCRGMAPDAKQDFLPKMPRCELVHMFLFYLIYELAKPDVNIDAWREKFDWAQHLTPSHTPKDIGKGWFTAASVVMLLPLSLYVKVIGVIFQVDILDQCINNPATKHMLIKDLPPLERYYLTATNRHLTILAESLNLMAQMNLITPTAKLPFKFAKDIACYLNQTASLKDTRVSLPGHCQVKHPEGKQFLETVFSFLSLPDIEQYWSLARNICLTTQLGPKRGRSWRNGKRHTLRDVLEDEEKLNTDFKPRGDGLGAAGFDSSLFCHLKQNWTWNDGDRENKSHPHAVLVKGAIGEDSVTSDWQLSFTTDTVPARRVLQRNGGRGTKRKMERPVEKEKAQKKKKLSKKDVKESEVSQQDSLQVQPKPLTSQSEQPPVKTRKVRKKRSRVIAKQTKQAKKKRSHWSVKIHDQRDLEATRQNEVMRVTYTPQEEKLVFICILALRILGKKSADTGYTDWLWTRDILYKYNYEHAKTKTALSISRKYRRLMNDPQTKVNLNICTADCVQEKEFQPYCNLGKGCDETGFNKLVELLKKKFSLESKEAKPMSLPRDLETIQKQTYPQSGLQPKNSKKSDKDIVSLKAPVRCISDIRQGISRDSLVSMLLLEDEKYNPNLAYAFLDQFTENELLSTITKLKKKHILTGHSLRYGPGREMALTAFSHKLSATGQRILDSHLSTGVIDDANCFYHQIQQGGTHSCDHLLSSTTEKSVEPESFALVEDSTVGGHVACILSLLATARLSVEMEVPEDILRVEFADKNNVLEKEIPSNSANNTKKHDTQFSEGERQQTVGAKRVQGKNEVCSIDGRRDLNFTKDRNCFTEVHLVESAKANVDMVSQDGSRGAAEALGTVTVGCETNTAQLVSGKTSANVDSANTRTIINEEQVHTKLMVKTTMGDTSINSRRYTPSSLDVPSGIEDHLFGSCGQSTNISRYELDLQSTSSFKCHLTTSHVALLNESDGHKLNNIQEAVDPPTSRACDVYNTKILPARIAGGMIRPVIAINSCSVKLSLLPSHKKESTQRKKNGAEELVAQHFKTNTHAIPHTLDECMSVCSKVFCYTEEHCQALTAVYESIENSKELGLTYCDVDKIVGERGFHSISSTQGLIDVLKAFNLVWEVGLVEARFVTSTFKKRWCLSFPHKEADQTKVSTGSTKDAAPDDLQSQMTSIGTQTDPALRRCHKHRNMPVNVSSAVEKSSGNMEIDEDTTVTKFQDVIHACVKNNMNQPGGHKEEELSVHCNLGNSASTNSSGGLKTVPNTGSKEEHVSDKTQLLQPNPLSRPWFSIDGQINTKAYNTFHKSVLGYIMRYPGVKQFTITKHFVNLIYPVTLCCILQTLEERHCIQKKCINQKKVTLFSSSTHDSEDYGNETKVTYFLPTADAVINLINHVLR